MSGPADPYDELPYTDHAYAESHPDRLAVVARLAGWEPPDLATARVLELGCGRGGNLLPMAAALPSATLVGVDRSARQIDEARRIASDAGLSNVRFVADTFEAIDVTACDFVVAHGVASWIPVASRRSLLAAVARSLAPGGIAYVSFNVLPGWYDRLAARDWLRFASGRSELGSLGWLRDRVSPELADYRRRLEAVERRLAQTERAYQVHEYLADEHHPILVKDLLAEAGRAGLRYLGDAIPSETAFELLPGELGETARHLDAADAQQLVDFVRCTAFRRALFVRADTCEARGWRWSSRLKVEALDDLRVASRLRPHAQAATGRRERFDGADISVEVDDEAARAALRALAQIAPRSRPLRELADEAGRVRLRTELFDLWLATGAVDLHVHEPPLGDGASARPVGCPVARWHAAHGGPITNRWHQQVELADAPLRPILSRLDGTRTVDEAARDAGCSGELAAAAVAALAASALLVGS